jgi:hypothetical protein
LYATVCESIRFPKSGIDELVVRETLKQPVDLSVHVIVALDGSSTL